jgi:hypothetical protein
MQKILSWLNDQHWYIIAGIVIVVLFFWTYGCESQVQSLMYPGQTVNRIVLSNELTYLVGLAKAREQDLDKQDEAKQAILDAATVIGSTGSINPAGLVNIGATILAISFGLNRNQKLKAELNKKSTNSA